MAENGRVNDSPVSRKEFDELKSKIERWSENIVAWTDKCATEIKELRREQNLLSKSIKELSNNVKNDNRELLNIRRQRNMLEREISRLKQEDRNIKENLNSVENISNRLRESVGNIESTLNRNRI